MSSVWDELRASFGFLPGLAMLVGIALGVGVPAVDGALDLQVTLFAFEDPESARSLLSTIATVTVTVAGLAFSVTVVGLTLASNQLSPRVLRTFRGDRTSQVTLAVFLGTFLYCVVVLVRLGAGDTADAVPSLSVSLAIVLAVVAFGLFAKFISHIIGMLQPSSVIAVISDDGRRSIDHRFPAGIGEEPDDPAEAFAAADRRMRSQVPRLVRAEGSGYLTLMRGQALVGAAASCDGLVRQVAPLGDYVVRGDVLAEVWCGDGLAGDDLAGRVSGAFDLGPQRTVVQDVAFPIRQLADIALKGLSPGVNDPTTAENALDVLTVLLVRFAESDQPSNVRVDGDGRPRLVARAPDLDDLARLGFEQVRVFAAGYPVVSVRMLELLERIRRAARAAGLPHGEVLRQAGLLRAGAGDQLPTAADQERVRTGPGR